MIACFWKDPDFFLEYAPFITQFYDYTNRERTEKICRDFSLSVDNTIFDCLTWFNMPFADVEDASKIPIAPEEFIMGIVRAQVAAQRRLDYEIPKLEERFEQLKNIQPGPFLALVKQGLEPWFKSQRLKQSAGDLNKDFVNFEDQLETFQRIEENSQVSQETCVKDFTENYEDQIVQDDFKSRDIYPCSIQGLNLATGGGFAKQEAVMIFAPESCGKTVIATQLARDYAEQNLNVLFVSTEQGQNELYPRFISNYCNIPFDKVKNGINTKALTDTQKASMQQWHTKIGSKRLKIVEWGGTAVDAKVKMEPLIKNLAKEGWKADVVIFDWLGGGLGELANKDLQYMRLMFKNMADTFCRIPRKHDLIFIYMMQASIGTALNKKLLDQSDLGECKGAGQNAAWGFAISGMHESRSGKNEVMSTKKQTWADEQFIHPFKVRKSCGGWFSVKRDFGYQRFKDNDDRLTSEDEKTVGR